jgi:hypothetical protein
MSSSLLFLIFTLLSLNVTELTSSPENVMVSVSMFTVFNDKLLNITRSKPRAESKSNQLIVNKPANSSLELVNEPIADNTVLVNSTVNSSLESVNED